ncbi:MAG: helix-turn-helix domain-containing protein, partial [Patescibacteria group bacterium]
MDISLFKQLGISEKAATIYITALSLGTASIQDLAQKSGLKRPTTYLHVDELLSQGLLNKIPIGKKEYYSAVDPSRLEQRATQQLSLLQDALPDLQRLQESAHGKPSITILEGEKGIKQIYDEIREANSIRFWAQLSTFERAFAR